MVHSLRPREYWLEGNGSEVITFKAKNDTKALNIDTLSFQGTKLIYLEIETEDGTEGIHLSKNTTSALGALLKEIGEVV